MIIWPIRMLGRIIADMGKISVSIGRIQEVLNEKDEDLESGLCPEIKGNIESVQKLEIIESISSSKAVS